MIYQSSRGGHRDGYATTIAKITGHKIYRKSGSMKDLKAVVLANTAFDICIEDGVFGFVFSGIARAMIGKKTVGLMMSPWDCFRPDVFSDYFRRWIFLILKRVKLVKVVIIVPFDLDQRYEKIADLWIYDPEFWDMQVPSRWDAALEVYRGKESCYKAERDILYFGRVDSDKGFDFLATIFLSNQDLFSFYRLTVVGVVSPSSRQLADRLAAAGARIVEEVVSDARMVQFISESSILWCCYSVKYDASSGIFGRAIQFNKLALVRKNSRISQLAHVLNAAVQALEFDNAEEASAILKRLALSGWSSKKVDTYKLYTQARRVLRQCLE